MKRLLFIPGMCLLFALVGQAHALSLSKSVFGQGGTVSSNGTLLLRSTAGQSIIGFSEYASEGISHGFWGTDLIVPTGVGDTPSKPHVFELKQNYPNPFNPLTTIPYSIGEGKTVRVRIGIYDVSGRLVTVLVDASKSPGDYVTVWQGFDRHGSQVSSGVYFYRLEAGTYVQTKKLVILK